MKNLSKILIAGIALLTPMFVFAEANTSGLLSLINKIQGLISAIIPVLIGLALLAFMWGVLRYLFGKPEEGKQFMIWGIIALFVMTSVWGLVSIVRSTILPDSNANQLNPADIPKAPRIVNN